MLPLELPVSQQRVTAIVYHATGSTTAIPLSPAGSQKNAGFFSRLYDRFFGDGSSSGPSYYIDSSGTGADTSSVDVGAPAGTGVYAPVDGVVVSVQPYVLNGAVRGSIVQIRPSNLAAVIVTVGNLDKHLNVDVGTPVTGVGDAPGHHRRPLQADPADGLELHVRRGQPRVAGGQPRARRKPTALTPLALP